MCAPEIGAARGVSEVVWEGDARWGGGKCDLGGGGREVEEGVAEQLGLACQRGPGGFKG